LSRARERIGSRPGGRFLTYSWGGVKRLAAGEHLVEHHAEREEVGPVVHLLALDLLGRHVVGRAQELPLLGEVRAVEAGDPEIGDLDLVVGGDEDVRRLDVAVDHPVRVRVVEGVAHLRDGVQHEGERQRLVALQQQLEVGPPHVLHGDEGEALLAGLHHVVDGDDVGVGENAGALRLAHEADAELLHLRIADGVADAEGLERHQAADQRVAGEVDDAHGPLADLVGDFVTAQSGRRQGEHGGKAFAGGF
jgi:hypothetical protein